MIKIMCFGTFDGLHPGHLSYFKQAKKLGDYLIAVVARDLNVKKIKEKLPKENEKKRLQTVQSCGLVDVAVMGSIKDKTAVIKKFQPDIIALGYDQKADTVKLRASFPMIKIIRLKAYKPEKYKSSLLSF